MMIKAQVSVSSAFKSLRAAGFCSRNGRGSSVFENFRLYSSTSSRDGLERPEIINQNDGNQTLDPISENGGQSLSTPVAVDPSEGTKCESITDRLRRLSQTSPEDFVPTAGGPNEMEKAKERYKDTMKQYREHFDQRERQRYSNQNYRGPRRGSDSWDFDGRQYRRFSTSAAQFRADSGEGIIDRLRRLSVTPDGEFKPSEGAQKIRETSEARQRSLGDVDIEQFDQRQDRPNNFGRQTHHHQRQGYGNRGGGYSRYGDDRQQNYQVQGRRSNNNWSEDQDGQLDSIERDPNKDSRLTQFFRNDRGSSRFKNDGDYGSQRTRSGSLDYQSSNYSDFQRRPRNNSSDGRVSNYDEFHPRRRTNSADDRSSNYEEFRRRPRNNYTEERSPKMSSEGMSNDSVSDSWKKFYSRNPGNPTSSVGKDHSEYNGQNQVSDRRSKPVNSRKVEEGYEETGYGSDEIERIRPLDSRSRSNRKEGHQNQGKYGEEADLELLALHSDPNSFGTLSFGPISVKDSVGSAVKQELIEDEKKFGLSAMEDEEEGDVRFIPEDKWNIKKLVKRVKELVEEKKVKDAIDTLLGALAQGGFPYDRGELVYCYNLCISACAQVGYVEMAFKLFNDLKKRGFQHKQSTFTSLFNACANSPWDKEKNIERMNRLRENMLEKGTVLNQVNYHSMIKGYGRCGDIEAAFAIVDEMRSQQIKPTTETFNMLLQACITIKGNGFRHVLVTWRKMQSMRIRPDIYSYNLLLRAIRECSIQLEPAETDGINSTKKTETKDLNNADIIRLPSLVTDQESNDMVNLICLNDSEKALMTINNEVEIPYTYEDVIQALALPENRLSVLGGLRGIMSQMSVDKVGPNMKTVNEFAQLIHPSDVSDLLMLMKTYKLKPNIDFFNLLIKRTYRVDVDKNAEYLLKLLPQYNLTPNIMTWGVVATGCRSLEAAEKLLMEMDEAEFVPNIEVMGALISNACCKFDPKYVLYMMQEMNKREVVPDTKFILGIDKFKQTVRKGLISQEMGKEVEPAKLKIALENWNERAWTHFCFQFKKWMEKTEVRIEPENPWTEDFNTFRQHRRHNVERTAEDDAFADSESSSNQTVADAAKSS